MTRARAWALALCCLSSPCLSSACTSQLELSLEGKQCQGVDGRCVRGFVCERQTNLCVRPEQLASAAADVGQGGAPDVSSSQSVLAADTESEPLAGAAGSGAGANGAAAGSGAGAAPLLHGGGPADPARDAGDAADAAVADACVPSLRYPDGDGDGVGLTSGGTLRCLEPGWVSQAGDCRDDQDRVFLGQTEFSATPFPDPTKPQLSSFDFDCSGSEEPDPSNSAPDPPPDCALRIPCDGSGYLPVLPARSGTGVEPRCGSNRLRRCVATVLLDCAPEDVLLAAELAFRCR